MPEDPEPENAPDGPKEGDAPDESGEGDAPDAAAGADESGEKEGRDGRTDGGAPEEALAIAGHEAREAPEGASDLLGAADRSDDDEDEEEVEPVELLVQLAKDGEIEPWDIDIVEVTDKFLDALDEADLRTSGRALFYASVLLRMKSDVLLEPDEPEEPRDAEPEPWEVDGEFDDGPAFDPVDALEAEMDRRLERKDARGTPETLDELVRSLRDAERGSWWKESRTYDTSESPSGFNRGTQTLDYHSGDDLRMDDEPTEADAFGTAHDENIEETIEDVESVLRTQYDAGRDEVLYEEISESGGTRVETFLALLFLAHRGTVRLDQDELFGDLWISQQA